jgi:hypothetical protein
MRLNKRKILAWAKGVLLSPYYNYMTYWRLKSQLGMNHLEREEISDIRKKKITESGGSIKNGIIQIDGLKFKDNSPQTPSALDEVFLHQEYNFFDSAQKWIVVDVGANIGDTALFFAKKENVEKVFSYEPVSPTFKVLQENLDLNEVFAKKIEAFCFGLGGGGGGGV